MGWFDKFNSKPAASSWFNQFKASGSTNASANPFGMSAGRSVIPEPKDQSLISRIGELTFDTPTMNLPRIDMGNGRHVDTAFNIPIFPGINVSQSTAEGLTTPGSLASAATGGITQGMGVASKAAQYGSRLLGGLQTGYGIDQLMSGNKGGIINTAMGIAGAVSSIPGKKSGNINQEVLPAETNIIPGNRRLGTNLAQPKGLLGPAANPELVPHTLPELPPPSPAFIAGNKGVALPQNYTSTLFGNPQAPAMNPPLPQPGLPPVSIPPHVAAAQGIAADTVSGVKTTTPQYGQPQIGISRTWGSIPDVERPAYSGTGSALPELLPPSGPKVAPKIQEPVVETGPFAGPSGTGPIRTITNPKLAAKKVITVNGKKVNLLKDIKDKLTDPDITAVPKTVSPLNWKEWIADWNNKRTAADYEGGLVRKKFDDLGKQGMKAVSDVQSGKLGQRYQDLRNYFNTKYKQVSEKIPGVNYRENYLPQLWKNTAEEVNQAFGKRVTQRPSFTLDRVFADYQEGISKGLTPRYESVADLAGWYEQSANKALAGRELFDNLRKSGQIKPRGKAPNGWQALDADWFPTIVSKNGGQMVWSAPPEIAKVINGTIKPNEGTLATIASPFSKLKNLALTGGIPGTGINWHTGVSMPSRAAAAAGINHPIRAAKRAIGVIASDFNPGRSTKYLDANSDSIVDAMKHGLTMGAEGFTMQTKPAEGVLSKVEDWFSHAPFQQIIPAAKHKAWTDTVADFTKTGMSEAEAKKQAASFVNHMFGGKNNLQDFAMGNAKFQNNEVKNLLQMALLAPDWAETKYRIGKGAFKGLLDPKNPVGQKYMSAVAAMAASLAVDSAARYAMTGEGAPNSRRIGNIPFPIADLPNKKAELDTHGTAFDTLEIPMRIGNELRKGDPIQAGREIVRTARGNTSIPMQSAINFIIGEDMIGRPTRDVDRYGNKLDAKTTLMNVIGELTNMATPQPIQGAYDFASGRQSGREAAAQALEFPMRWYRPQPWRR